jgi:two-component system, NtrC family, sensor histidine kinase KinB
VTVRTKLLLAQLPLALSLLVLGAVSRRTVAALGHNAEDILKDNYLSVLAAQRVRDAADTMADVALMRAHGQKSAVGVDELTRQRETLNHELAFQEHNITEVGEREMTARLRTSWSRFADEFDRVMRAPPADAERIYFEQLKPVQDELHAATNDITAINEDAMVRKSNRARASAAGMSGFMIAVTIAAFLIGIATSIYLTNRLTRPLSVLAQAVRRIAEGDLQARARVEGRDEIAQVARELNVMTDRLAEYRSSSLGELLQAQQSSQAAIDSIADPVIVLNADGSLLNVNRACETLLGLSTESPQPFANVEPAVRAVIDRMRQHVLEKGGFVPRGLEEAVAVSTREGTRYLLPRANPVVGEGGGTLGLTIVLQDVTRLRRFDELKTDMVATVAHEFRTPLTSLRMAIHLCTEGVAGPLTPKQADLLYAARDDCERLQSIVDDLLDLSRIQGGQMELNRRSVSAAALIARALDEHRAQARQGEVDLDVGAPSVDRPVIADPERMDLVLGNLLANAIRHTPAHGRVDVRAAPDGDELRFEVRDTGPGIAPEHLPRLFERFYRTPDAPSGGAGLGLYICKEIVTAHGGRIGVESDLGHGAVFWFTLPRAPDAEPAST